MGVLWFILGLTAGLVVGVWQAEIIRKLVGLPPPHPHPPSPIIQFVDYDCATGNLDLDIQNDTYTKVYGFAYDRSGGAVTVDPEPPDDAESVASPPLGNFTIPGVMPQNSSESLTIGYWGVNIVQHTDGIDHDCPSGSGEGFAPTKVAEVAGRNEYRIASDNETTPGGSSSVLRKTGPETGAILNWESCSKTNPSVDWRLWVKSLAGRPLATLVLQRDNGRRLEVPLVWKCGDWNPDGLSRFTFSGPDGSPLAGSVVIATPA